MKKLRLRQKVKDIIAIVVFYVIIIIGVILINGRLG